MKISAHEVLDSEFLRSRKLSNANILKLSTVEEP